MNRLISLKKKSDLHLARKAWHFFGVLSITFVHYQLSSDQSLRWMAFAAFVAVSFDLLRNRIPRLNQFSLRIFGPFMREYERNSLAGTTYLFLGAFCIIWFFPKVVVSICLLFLAVADPLASYVGTLYGKDKLIGPKSLQGTVAAFFACTLISFLYLYFHDILTHRLLVVSLLMGLFGAISELVPIGKLDDNLTFPIVSAIFVWLILTRFGGFIG